MEDETMDEGMHFGTEADDAWQRHEQYIRGGFRNVIGDLFVNTGGDDPDDEGTDEVIDGPYPDPPQQHHAEPPPNRPPWINRIVDMDKLMSDLFRPGTNHVTDGMRGGGKTHQAVAYTEAMVKGAFPSMPHVVMLTNIIFVKRVSKVGSLESQFVMETPPGVYHVTSMEEMFRVITRLFRQYGRTNVMFMLVLLIFAMLIMMPMNTVDMCMYMTVMVSRPMDVALTVVAVLMFLIIFVLVLTVLTGYEIIPVFCLFVYYIVKPSDTQSSRQGRSRGRPQSSCLSCLK